MDNLLKETAGVESNERVRSRTTSPHEDRIHRLFFECACVGYSAQVFHAVTVARNRALWDDAGLLAVVDRANPGRRTLVSYAAARGNADRVVHLLKSGENGALPIGASARFEQVDSRGYTLLMNATSAGRDATAAQIVALTVEALDKDNMDKDHARTRTRKTAAAVLGMQTRWGSSALGDAISGRLMETLAALLAAGVVVETHHRYAAEKEGREEVLRLLDTSVTFDTLMEAVNCGWPTTARVRLEVLQADAATRLTPQQAGDALLTVLETAGKSGKTGYPPSRGATIYVPPSTRLPLIQALVEAGADVTTARGPHGCVLSTAFNTFTHSDVLSDVVLWLLDRGASVSTIVWPQPGQRAYWPSSAVVARLLAAGVPVDVMFNGNFEMTRVLQRVFNNMAYDPVSEESEKMLTLVLTLQRPVDFRHFNIRGRTSLSAAIKSGSAALVEALLSSPPMPGMPDMPDMPDGARLDVSASCYDDGTSPLDAALERKDEPLALRLLDRGASGEPCGYVGRALLLALGFASDSFIERLIQVPAVAAAIATPACARSGQNPDNLSPLENAWRVRRPLFASLLNARAKAEVSNATPGGLFAFHRTDE